MTAIAGLFIATHMWCGTAGDDAGDAARLWINGLAAKQLDAQISLLVMPQFSKGLPPSLEPDEKGVRCGLKGVQICANSIVPHLLHLANPIATLFPTHAEQFNQNINSQGFNAAMLAAESLRLLRHHLSASLLFGVQAVELRSRVRRGSCDARAILSPPLRELYDTFYAVLERQPAASDPIVAATKLPLDEVLLRLGKDLESPCGKILDLVKNDIRVL